MSVDHDADALVVKALTGKAIAAAGGTKGLAPLIRQQRLSDLQNVGKPDIVRLNEAALLDALSPGWPYFAHYLATRAGFALVRLPDPDAPDSIWSKGLGAVLKECGDISAGLGADLADDNDVSPEEAQQRMPDADELVAAAVHLREALQRRAEGKF